MKKLIFPIFLVFCLGLFAKTASAYTIQDALFVDEYARIQEGLNVGTHAMINGSITVKKASFLNDVGAHIVTAVGVRATERLVIDNVVSAPDGTVNVEGDLDVENKLSVVDLNVSGDITGFTILGTMVQVEEPTTLEAVNIQAAVEMNDELAKANQTLIGELLFTESNYITNGDAVLLSLDNLDVALNAHTHTLDKVTDVTAGKDEVNLLVGATGTIWTSDNDGASSLLDSDILDGQEGSFYQNASNLQSGTLSVDYYSSYSDLSSEGFLNANSDGDLLTRTQSDGRYLMGEADTLSDVTGRNANTADQVSFNFTGAPFVVATDTLVTNLNADKLDGNDSLYYTTASNIGIADTGSYYSTEDVELALQESGSNVDNLQVAVGSMTYTEQNYAKNTYASLTQSIDAIDIAINDAYDDIGNVTYTDNNVVTDGQTLTASVCSG